MILWDNPYLEENKSKFNEKAMSSEKQKKPLKKMSKVQSTKEFHSERKSKKSEFLIKIKKLYAKENKKMFKRINNEIQNLLNIDLTPTQIEA